MKIGAYEVIPVQAGTFGLDGGAMFGVVPRALWSGPNPPDDHNRIAVCARLLVLRGPERTWLVDTGLGDKFDAKKNSIYANDGMMPDEALRAADIDPAGITDVLLTHLHFDHAGGATRADGSATFPRARYHVQRSQLEWAREPTVKDRGSFRPDDFLPLYREGRFRLMDGPGELDDGLEVLVVDGHTPGMQLPKLSDGERTLLYTADLVPTATHLRLPFIMAYDNEPLATLEEKRRILSQAAREGWTLFFEHDVNCMACRVVEEGAFGKGEEVAIG